MVLMLAVDWLEQRGERFGTSPLHVGIAAYYVKQTTASDSAKTVRRHNLVVDLRLNRRLTQDLRVTYSAIMEVGTCWVIIK